MKYVKNERKRTLKLSFKYVQPKILSFSPNYPFAVASRVYNMIRFFVFLAGPAPQISCSTVK